VGGEQRLDPPAEVGVVPTSTVQIAGPDVRVGPLEGLGFADGSPRSVCPLDTRPFGLMRFGSGGIDSCLWTPLAAHDERRFSML
jgi:hypothetical protein